MARERVEGVLRVINRPNLPEMRIVDSDNGLVTELKTTHSIRRILFPGCWIDGTTLQNVFTRGEVFHMDMMQSLTHGGGPKNMPHFVVGRMMETPFPNGFFDAMFYEDVHAPRWEFRGALKSLRVGGVVIYSTHDCGDPEGVQPKDLFKMPELRVLPVHSPYYLPFEKVTELRPNSPWQNFVETWRMNAKELSDFLRY